MPEFESMMSVFCFFLLKTLVVEQVWGDFMAKSDAHLQFFQICVTFGKFKAMQP